MKKYSSVFLMMMVSLGMWAQSTFTQNGVMYEVNTRQYSVEGNFDAVAKNIPTLKGLGIDMLWLMPVHPIGAKNRKGTMGSYYSVQNYRGIDPSYGGEKQLHALIKTAHAHGMKVIIDWVANHTAWDHAWITEHPDWYVQDSAGNIVTQYDWTDVAKLNFANKDMRKAMMDDMAYWVKEFDIDGFRCDVAFLVPQDFWEQTRAHLETIKPMYMLAEMEWNADITKTPDAYFNKAFNTSYGWNYMGVSGDMAKGKKSLEQFRKEMRENYAKFPQQMTKLFFITNHDENSWNGTINEKYGNNWKLYATLCYTLPQSAPLMYTGEEAGLNRRLSFFEKDPITEKEWADTSRYAWYRNLIALRHMNKALWNDGKAVINELTFPGADTSLTNKVYAFSRTSGKNEVVVITNFGNTDMVFEKGLGEINPAKYAVLFDTKALYKNKAGQWCLKANENIIFYK